MVLGEGVGARRVEERAPAFRLVLGNHLFAAAGVSGERRDGEPRVRRQNSCFYKRRDERDETARVAAGDRNAAGGPDRFFPAGAEFRESIGPARRRAVRGARVQHNGIGIGDETYRFNGSRVRQTENRDICAVQRVAAGFRVLSGFFRERDKGKFLTAF